MVAFSEDISAVVLPIKVIFLEAMVERARVGSLKGGFCRPCLEARRNFWFEGGMESSAATRSERSDIVAYRGKDRVTGLPWCVSVNCSSSEDAVGAESESVSAMMESPVLWVGRVEGGNIAVQSAVSRVSGKVSR